MKRDLPLLTFVVPCYNEAPRVSSTLDHIRQACDLAELTRYEILVVDDCSNDNTSEVAEDYIAKTETGSTIQLIKNEVNKGLGRTFADTAFLGSGTYYRLVCGDDTESPETIAAIIGMLGQADVVIPVHPKSVPGKPLFRRLLSWTFTGLVNLISGYRIGYYNGCALLLRYDVMRWSPYSYGFQADLTTRLLDEGRSYKKVFVHASHVEKSAGESAIKMRNLLSVGHTLLEIGIRRVRRTLYPSTPIVPPESKFLES